MIDVISHSTNSLSEERFGQIFKRCRPAFIKIANSYVHDTQAAEDITDDCFIKLWEKRGEIVTENYEAYALRSIKNRCLDHLKLRTIQAEARQNMEAAALRMHKYDIASLQSCNPDALFASDVEEIFRKCIDNMPSLTREIFIYSRFKDMTYGEISEKTGIPVRQVTSHMQYALRMLRHDLYDYLVVFIFLIAMYSAMPVHCSGSALKQAPQPLPQQDLFKSGIEI